MSKRRIIVTGYWCEVYGQAASGLIMFSKIKLETH